MTAATGTQLSPKRQALLEKLLRQETGSRIAKPSSANSSNSDFIDRLPGVGPFPLSFPQERLWFLEHLSQGAGAGLYNVPAAVRLRGAVDVQVLSRALGALVRRHEVLRTRFMATASGPVQTVLPPPADGWVKVSVADLSSRGTTLAEREAQAAAAASAEARRPFDLCGEEPLLRAALFRLSREDHVLLLTLHHIACDGWSMGVLGRELSAVYERLQRGQTTEQALSSLGPLPLRYVEFASWQRKKLSPGTAELTRLLSYWRQRLDGLTPLSLPTDRPRPPVQSFIGAYEPISIDSELLQELEKLGHHQQATVFMVMLAGFVVLLSRYSGHEDVAVGSPIANRTRPELEELVGFFVNTLVLRVDASGDPTFTELVQRTRECALGAYAHQDLPFERLVEELHPERDLGRNPLFQVLFQLQASISRQVSRSASEQASDSSNELQTGVAKFDLTFNLWQTDNGLVGQAEYSSDLFDRSTIASMVVHYRTLLRAAVSNPSARISSLPIIGPAERARIVAELNIYARRDYPGGRTVHALFQEQAALTPHATAMQWEGEPDWTYADLNNSAEQIAVRLSALGASPGERVAVCLPRGGLMVAATIAALKTGAAYVPLDPSYPAARLQFMLKDSGARVVVVGAAADTSIFTGLPTLTLSRERQMAAPPGAQSSPDNLSPVQPVSAADPCYVIYTSGSTGEPKGVIVPHRAVVRLVRNCDYCPLGPSDAVAQSSNAAFDAATFEIWGALLNGARLVGISRETTLSPLEFSRRLRERGVTTLFVTTALFNVLVREAPPDCFAPLRCLLFGGEAVDARAVRSLLYGEGGRIAPERLLHVYGPTENTTFSTWHQVTREDVVPGAELRGGASVPIGRPIANSTALVLDPAMNPVPEGVPGELYVGGEGLALGYLNRPELTAQSFVRVPLGLADSRMYRTGDGVRWRRREGTRNVVLEFLGRLDDQVKVRGFRVEPGEIEAALRGCAGVRDAVVIVHSDGGDRQLFVYVVPQTNGQSVSANGLRQELRSRVPAYMVPAGIMLLGSLPLTANGKVDRSALPEPVFATTVASSASPVECTDLEQRIAEQWQQVLGLRSVGMEDNFFDVGGHSLRLVEVHSRLRQALDPALLQRANLSIVDLFRFPTISALARHLEWAGINQSEQAAGSVNGKATSAITPSEQPVPAACPPDGGRAPRDAFAKQIEERIKRQKDALARHSDNTRKL